MTDAIAGRYRMRHTCCSVHGWGAAREEAWKSVGKIENGVMRQWQIS